MKKWFLSVKSNKVKYILLLCVAVQLLCTGLYLMNYLQTQKSAQRELSGYSTQLAESISKELQRNNTYLEATAFDKTYREMFGCSGMEWVNRVSQLQSMYALCNNQSGTDYYFFIVDVEKESFLEMVAVRMPFAEYRPVRAALMEICKNDDGNDQLYRLLTLEDGSRVIYTVWRYDGFACGCWISEKEFLRNAAIPDPKVMYDIVLETGADGTAIPMVKTDFRFSLHWIDSQRQMGTSIMALVQTILSLGMVVGLFVITNTVNQRLLLPVQNLTGILEKFSKATRPGNGARWSNAIDDAGEILERLGMQVDSLRLKLAESELEKQRLNLNFRSLQIRPHFLVNNLAMINGMAQVGELEKIKAVTVRLSNYYRYVLRDATDLVPLHLELTHLKNLFEVTQVCNGQTIQALFHVDEAVRDVQIPVLLISTFAENSIKYAQNASGELVVEVWCRTAQEAPGMLRIQILDNGAGFSPEVISVLESGVTLEQTGGRRIGINNCIRRLELLYGDRARISFSNRAVGGAMVEILLPMEVEQ